MNIHAKENGGLKRRKMAGGLTVFENPRSNQRDSRQFPSFYFSYEKPGIISGNNLSISFLLLSHHLEGENFIQDKSLGILRLLCLQEIGFSPTNGLRSLAFCSGHELKLRFQVY